MHLKEEEKMKYLNDDLVFKNVFSKEEILQDLINSYFKYIKEEREFKLTKITPEEYIMPNNKKVKGYYGDIVGILDNGDIISLEMYKNKFSKREYKKSFSYLCRLVSNELEVGDKKYEEIHRVIGISFMKGDFRRINKEIVNKYKFEKTGTRLVIDEGDIELNLIRIDKVEASQKDL